MKETTIFEKYIIMIWIWYPILIMAERYISFIGTALTGTVLLAMLGIIVLKGKKRKLIKYLFLFYCYDYGKQFYIGSEVHRSIFIGLLVTVVVFDLCTIEDIKDSIFVCIDKNRNLLEGNLWINLIINSLMIFVPYGYSSVYSDIWSLNAFQGIYVDPHQLAYKTAALMILLLPLILMYHQPRYCLLLIGFTGIMVLSGARVPTAFGIVILCYGIKVMNIHFVNRKNISFRIGEKVIIIMMIWGVCMGSFFLLSNTSFVEKMRVTLSENDFDSGRAGLVQIDKEYFDSAPKDKQLLGSGTEKTYELHREKAYAYIWSHNDFMQLLVGNGLITCIIYAWSMLEAIFIIVRKKILDILMGIGIFFLAWMNGLLIYPRLVCVLPVLIAVQNVWESMRVVDEG